MKNEKTQHTKLNPKQMIDRLQEPETRKPEPSFDMDEFEDEIMSSNQNYRHVKISYEAYEYDGAVRIVKLKVNLNDILPCFFDYLEEQILESIGLRINKNNIVLETRIEYV